jgi:hypothetical protein
MIGVKKLVYLILPALFIGLPLVCFFALALPVSYGLPLAALLAFGILTGLSLLHRCIGVDGDGLLLQILLYCGCLALSILFAIYLIPDSLGADTIWLKIFFVAVQQALYIGIHAVRGVSR